MSLEKIFRDQSIICTELGSPFMGQLMRLFSDRIATSPPVNQLISKWIGQPDVTEGVLPLRIAGALHALVLLRKDAGLDAVYPPHAASPDDLWSAVAAAFTAHSDFILTWLNSPPQTNEIRRSAAIWAAAQVVSNHFDMPLSVMELGASAGLNLLFDHYRVETPHFSSLTKDPILTVHPDWRGGHPAPRGISVHARAGVDLIALDPQNADHMLRLRAYTWPDQAERLERLTIAAPHQVTPIDQGDAADWLGAQLAKHADGSVRFVFSTVAWQYFDADSKRRCIATLNDAQAGPDSPIVFFRMETDGRNDSALLSLQIWPSRNVVELGRADYRGRWIEWTHNSDRLPV
jgi:hypothetical protein